MDYIYFRKDYGFLHRHFILSLMAESLCFAETALRYDIGGVPTFP